MRLNQSIRSSYSCGVGRLIRQPRAARPGAAPLSTAATSLPLSSTPTGAPGKLSGIQTVPGRTWSSSLAWRVSSPWSLLHDDLGPVCPSPAWPRRTGGSRPARRRPCCASAWSWQRDLPPSYSTVPLTKANAPIVGGRQFGLLDLAIVSRAGGRCSASYCSPWSPSASQVRSRRRAARLRRSPG